MKSVTFRLKPDDQLCISQLFADANGSKFKLEVNTSNNSIIIYDLDENNFEKAHNFVEQFGTIDSIIMDNDTTVLSQENDGEGNIINPGLLLQETLNSLVHTIRWAIQDKGIPSNTIRNYLVSFKDTLINTFSEVLPIEVEPGQMVSVRMGQNLPGELSGRNIPCIVCFTDSTNLAYVVPLVSKIPNGYNEAHALRATKKDLIYGSKTIVLLEKGQPIHKSRIKKINCKVTATFMATILEGLNDYMAKQLNSEIPGHHTKMSKLEAALREKSEEDLVMLQNGTCLKDAIYFFMIGINMAPEEYPLLPDAFSIAFSLSSSENKTPTLTEISRKLTETNNDPIRLNTWGIKSQFSRWLNLHHPKIAKECRTISFIELFQIFKSYYNS